MEHITWSKFDKLCEDIAKKILASGKQYKFIYGISRNGLVPAVILSHKLGIRMCGDTFNPHKENFLVIDDINDSGRTLFPHTRAPGCDTVAIFSRVTAKTTPTYIGEVITHNEWLVMPFENKKEAFADMTEYLNEAAGHGTI